MKLKQIHSKELLTDNHDQYEAFGKSMSFHGIPFNISSMQLLKNLENEKLKELLYNEIVNKKESLFGGYQSQEGFSLYVKQYNEKIIIIAAGEKQSSRYQSFIEGVWEVKDYV